MSGPKCGSYEVVSPAELVRRRLAAVRDRLQRQRVRALAHRDAAGAARDAYGVSVSDVKVEAPACDDVEQLEEFASRQEAQLAAAEEQLLTAVAAARVASLLQHLIPSNGAEASVVDFGHSVGRSDGARSRTVQQRVQARAERAAELLRAADPAMPEAAQRECAALATECAAASDVQTANACLELLRTRCRQENEKADAVRERGAQLDRMLASLDGLEGDDAASMRGRLRATDLSADLTAGLAEEVERIRHDAVAMADDRFALAAAQASLTSIGFAVGASFETEVAGEGSLVPLPSSPRHAVRIRRRRGQLMFNVVRFDERGLRSHAEDTRAEEQFCEGFLRFQHEMKAAGVDVELTLATPPGSAPMQVVPQARPRTKAAGTSTEARENAARLRELPK